MDAQLGDLDLDKRICRLKSFNLIQFLVHVANN